MTAATTGWPSRAVGRFVRVPGLGPRATALGVAITTRLVVAHAVAALFVITYLVLTDTRDDRTWGGLIARNAIIFAVGVTVFSVASVLRGKHVFGETWRWLDEQRPPTDTERRELLRQPMRIALFPLRYWFLACLLSIVGSTAEGEPAIRIVLVAATTIEGGVVAALLGFLLGDRALRPVFAEALAGSAPDTPPSLGLGYRLVLGWALGTGLPLVGIVITPFATPDADLDPKWAMGFLATVGIVAGVFMMGVIAKSIVQPLGQVRRALAAVEAGDLEVTVVVDDPGELGQLQAGVNEMVAGLRQRAELEDLFGRHVGAPVVRRALEHGVELGGETRCVSALFVDVTNSTALARHRDPQEVVALLNRFFAAVVDACDAEGGWLDDYQGDGALCIWGAPVDQPDHAVRALRAARSLAATLTRLRSDLPDLDAGIGVATGDAVAGNVGTELRLEYTVIGPPVNTAARLTVAAKQRPGRLLADANAVEAAGRDEARCWRPSAPVDLKGLDAGLAVFEPVLVA